MPKNQPLFDGNRTNRCRQWLVPQEQWETMTDETMATLVEIIADGQLAWVFIPWNGFRFPDEGYEWDDSFDRFIVEQ